MGQFMWAKWIFRTAAGLLLIGLSTQTVCGAPFGPSTKLAPEEPLAVVWQGLQSKISSEQSIVKQCRLKPRSCSSDAARRFIAIIDEGERYDGLARIGHINRAIDLAIKAINNGPQYGSLSKWTSPLATLARGFGDCKQYAVLKYAALNDAGFGLSSLRILIVQDKLRREQHALAAVHYKGHWIILNNLTLALVESDQVLNYYTPLYSLDHRGVKRFVQPIPRQPNTPAITAAAPVITTMR
jgi:predicted transglutaminase-like cysteine proteinase